MQLKPGLQLPSLTKEPNELALFTYCAATWNQHRIHYDRDYARFEGHRDLVVPGPMQGEWLVQLVGAWISGEGRIRMVRYRNVRPAFVNQRFHVEGLVTQVEESAGDAVYDVTCSVWVMGPGGKTTEGTIVLEIPMVLAHDVQQGQVTA